LGRNHWLIDQSDHVVADGDRAGALVDTGDLDIVVSE
jgi:hypothetical protein